MSNQDTNQNHSPLLAEVRTELSQIIKVEDSEQAIWITPVCNFFKISYDSHRRLILEDPILSSILLKKANYSAFGDNRQRLLLPKFGFIRWIQLINPKTIDSELKDKFIKFQMLIFEYLYGEESQQKKEAELFKSIAAKKEQRKRLADEIRKEQAALNHIYATKYGQLQLEMGVNEN